MAKPLLDLDALSQSWLITLRGERKSPSTLKVYRSGVAAFLTFCQQHSKPAELTKENVREFMASLADAEPATARLRLTALKLFARWMADEDDINFDPDPILAVKAPKLDDKAVPDLTEGEVKRLLKACTGKALRDKRDFAMLALLLETGLRAAELLSMDVADVDCISCTAHVKRGKGGEGRNVKFSASTAAAIDRYKRTRLAAGSPSTGPLWISSAHRRLSYRGMANALKVRAELANVDGFHVHRTRHTAAVRWLRSGGSESGLMAQSGWASRKMVDRYVKSAAEDLAAEEFDRLGIAVELDR